MKRKRLSAKNQLAVAAYEAAAERIGREKNFYACTALHKVASKEHTDAFWAWFKPRRPFESDQGAWWPDVTFGDYERTQLPERTMRILALLLMAELVRDGQIDFDAL